MGMQCDVNEGDRLVDGLIGCTAVVHAGRELMEVWDEDYDTFLGFLPATATPVLIHAALEFYRKGHKHGRELGGRDARAKMRAALAD